MDTLYIIISLANERYNQKGIYGIYTNEEKANQDFQLLNSANSIFTYELKKYQVV